MISVAYITHRNYNKPICQQDNPRLPDQSGFRLARRVRMECDKGELTEYGKGRGRLVGAPGDQVDL